jgi:hypothetical protein
MKREGAAEWLEQQHRDDTAIGAKCFDVTTVWLWEEAARLRAEGGAK